MDILLFLVLFNYFLLLKVHIFLFSFVRFVFHLFYSLRFRIKHFFHYVVLVSLLHFHNVYFIINCIFFSEKMKNSQLSLLFLRLFQNLSKLNDFFYELIKYDSISYSNKFRTIYFNQI